MNRLQAGNLSSRSWTEANAQTPACDEAGRDSVRPLVPNPRAKNRAHDACAGQYRLARGALRSAAAPAEMGIARIELAFGVVNHWMGQFEQQPGARNERLIGERRGPACM